MNASIFLAAAVVLCYVFLGGLTSSIYNEVIQFFLIWFGILPVTILGLMHFGGWEMLTQNVTNFGSLHLWEGMDTTNNPMGVDWIGLVSGLGFVLSFGYWCTDFLVIQRALAAKDLRSAQRTPLIAAYPKILFPVITVVPGIIAAVAIPQLGKMEGGYDMALPLLITSMYPEGMIGLGITALLASFMSGMAGNVTAFNTVWTYDIYQSYIAPGRSDKHYLWMGRAATAGGIVISIAAAYLCMSFPTIMEYMQLIFSFFNAPLFATFALGMFWVRTTPWGAFIGLLLGTLAAIGHYFATEAIKIGPEHWPSYLAALEPSYLGWKRILTYQNMMAANFYRATFAWVVCCVVTVVVSLFTKPKSKRELVGLVWGLTKKSPRLEKEPWYITPMAVGALALFITLVLNIIFW